MLKKWKCYSFNINLKFIIGCFLLLIFLVITFIRFNDSENDMLMYKEVSIKEFLNIEVQSNYVEELKENYNNTDIVGVISIDDTEISEIVLQSEDNSYYLEHNVYKEYDKYGSIFMDYRINLSNSRKILIFGHNSSYIDTPFGDLENYYDKEYYKEHKYINFQTETDNRLYEIFSVYIETENWNYMNLNFDNDSEWYQHLLGLYNKSMYDTGVEINSDDEIIILQTCSNHESYSKYNKKYLLVIGKRIAE